MTVTIAARTAQKFLSVLPHVCGYVPRRSLVVVPVSDGRTVGVARLDLPRDESAWAEVAATALGVVCRLRDVTRFTAVVYTDEPFRSANGVAFEGFMDYLRERADHCGLDVVDALCVAADGWGSYLSGPLPGGGRPLAEISFEGALPPDAAPSPVAADQEEGAGLPVADLAEKERVGRALHDLDRAFAALSTAERPEDVASRSDGPASDSAAPGLGDVPARALATACLVGHLPTVFEESLGWDADALDPHLAALLVWALARPHFRDVALSQWSLDLAEGYATLAFNDRWAAGDRTEPDGPLRLMGEGPRPDAERLETAIALVRRLAASAPRASRAGALAAAAWLSWALGRATHAAQYIEQVAEIDPEHGLAGIVGSMVEAGYLPPWAFERPAA